MESKFYSFSATSLQGKEVKMDAYKGKTILVVNTASKCGLTPQYEGLEKLYQKYSSEGLVILGFPCNQFGNQEPGDEKSISEGCLVNYGVTFPMFSKVDVNGKQAHPIFKYLKDLLPGFLVSTIKWNFTKFLVDAHGNPIQRFAPTTKPEDMESEIVKALALKNLPKGNFGKLTLSQQIARIVLGSFLLLAGVGHLTWARTEFLAQVPTWLPLNGDLVVVLSGLVEIGLGLSLLFYKQRRFQVGLLTGLFFVLIFPGNISQYVNGINGFGLDTDNARFIRLFFQPVLIWLALWSTGSLKFWKLHGLKAFFLK